MSEYVVKLPDVGEGIAEAEIVEWHVAAGDTISEDQVMVEVMLSAHPSTTNPTR